MGTKEMKDGKVVKQWNIDFTKNFPSRPSILNRNTQGVLLILASSMLLLNNLGNPLGATASILFLMANALGLYIHHKK